MTREEAEAWFRKHFKCGDTFTARDEEFISDLCKPSLTIAEKDKYKMVWPDELKGEMFEVNEYNDMKPRREEHEEPKVYKEENKTAWTSFNS